MTNLARLSFAGAVSVLAMGVTAAYSESFAPTPDPQCSASDLALARSGQGFPSCARYATDTTADANTNGNGDNNGRGPYASYNAPYGMHTFTHHGWSMSHHYSNKSGHSGHGRR